MWLGCAGHLPAVWQRVGPQLISVLICKSVIISPTLQGWDEEEEDMRGSLHALSWGQIMNASILPVSHL